jgi:hypothetical protein
LPEDQILNFRRFLRPKLNKEARSRYWKEDKCIQNFGRTDLVEKIALKLTHKWDTDIEMDLK